MAVSRRGIEEVVVDPVPFGRYVLLDAVAEGRTGTVYRACLAADASPDRLFAIKRVSLELSRDPSFAQQFEAMMSRAAELEHDAHCAIEDVGRARDGSLYAAMPFVSGKDLGRIADVLHERGVVMPAPLLAYVGGRIADALAAAHTMSYAGLPVPLFHGELAPADILIGYDGTVCLTGLSSVALQAVSPDPAPRYGYRAPELDQGICNAQSDIFSLGACLSELLTGRPTARLQTREEGGRPESHIRRVVPRPLEQIVSRALVEDPAARWKSAAKLSSALQRWCSTQSTPGNAAALSEFMYGLFDAAHELEATRLEAGLARLATTRPISGSAPAAHAAPESRASYPQLVRASESARARTQVRARVPRADEKKAASSATAQHDGKRESWTDPAEETPARGVLMQELAAEMAGTERKPEPAPANVSDNPWDDESPADRWISEGEEREALEWRMQPRKPAPAQIVAAPLVAPVRAAVVQAPALAPLFAPEQPAHGTRWRVPALAAGVLLAVIATVMLLRSTGSRPHTAPLQGALPTPTSAKSNPEPTGASAAATDLDLVKQTARTEVVQTPAPQTTRAPDATGSGSDRERSRRRRATSERTGNDSEPDVAEATTEANAAGAAPAPAVFAPTSHREPASMATEQTAPVPSRARPESISATAPASEPIAKAVTPAPAPRPAIAPAAQAPAATATRGPSHPAVLVERTTPRLSARARRIGVTEGVAQVELTIDASGAVTNASVVKAEPPEILEGSALNAVREWRYQPALANGTPVASKQRVTIRFAE